jgi:hypothetical protein
MIKSLKISNIAIVREVALELDAGFTVLTRSHPRPRFSTPTAFPPTATKS